MERRLELELFPNFLDHPPDGLGDGKCAYLVHGLDPKSSMLILESQNFLGMLDKSF